MGRPGFEPGTSRLKAECSTAELATRIHFFNVFYYSRDIPTCSSILWLQLLRTNRSPLRLTQQQSTGEMGQDISDRKDISCVQRLL